MLLPERDCQKCTALMQRERGCESDAPIPMVLDGAEIKRCPRRPIKENPRGIETVLLAYRSYIRGYLPDPGSLQDQGYRYVRSMQIVDMAVTEAEAELRRRAASK